MSKTYIDVVNSISSILSSEKAHQIPAICNRYNLEPREEYSSPTSKEKYIKNILLEKSDQFILELANEIIKDYRDDNLGLALNNYYDGKYFRLSVVTRTELLSELYTNNELQGALSSEEFLKACNLDQFVALDINTFFSFMQPSVEKTIEKNLIEELKKIRLQDKLDERFFVFLEQIVHPYTRSNQDAEAFVNLINTHLVKDRLQIAPSDNISGHLVYKISGLGGINEPVKNLIFAAAGFKPEIVIEDALSNRIRIVKNAEYCLVYDRPLKTTGLMWIDMVNWWAKLNNSVSSLEQAVGLRNRLRLTLASEPEIVLFDAYYSAIGKQMGKKLPALIPQVYLHYDPYSIRQHGVNYLLRQRMDFLILINNARIVIEVDGKQHYSTDDKPSPKKYSEMVRLDRELKLLGYEVYRFGGYELTSDNTDEVKEFFNKLFIKHKLLNA
ncbi:MAG: hypothetical protein EOO88_14395 [Pedobacter sp.]|nr:MAG: hypothetical protein EOO88_14395 [Pedobacter sp.]